MAKKTAGTRAKAAKRAKSIYHFGGGKADGHAGLRELLGGKGANLAEMSRIGLPVPPGFTIATTACQGYYDNRGRLPAALVEEVHKAIGRLERETGKRWGRATNPLLVSVRSGAAVSMPGMMDTVLNLGLTEEVTEGLAKLTGNRRFALDARRRFIQMFGNVVEGLGLERFEHILRTAQAEAGVYSDSDLSAEVLEGVVAQYLEAFESGTGRAFPDDPYEQLERSIGAVFGSWMGNRAQEYRRIHKIQNLLGTAVNVQSMVFGNLGADSGTGVCFTRDPATGENVFYGEFLMNAQGEDVVAGIRTPEPLEDLGDASPKAYRQLTRVRTMLERHYRDIQDIEFTIERGTLYILQTRTGKTTARAAVRIAVEMAKKRLISRETAVLRITPEQVDQLLHPQFDSRAERKVLTRGLPASPGAVSGEVVFTAEEAKEKAGRGIPVILVRDGDEPRGRRGHACGAGDPDGDGGHDLPRRRRRSRHGQVLRGGRLGGADRRGRPDLPHRGPPLRRRRHPLPGRVDRPGDGGCGGHDARRSEPRVPGVARLGRWHAAPEGPGQCGCTRGRPGRPQLRRRGHRPLPHRAHVLRRRTHRGDARDDPRGRRGRASRGSREAAAVPAQRLRRASWRRWTGCR